MSEAQLKPHIANNSYFLLFKKRVNRKTIGSFYVESSLLNELDALAKAEGISRSELVSFALKQFLQEVEKE